MWPGRRESLERVDVLRRHEVHQAALHLARILEAIAAVPRERLVDDLDQLDGQVRRETSDGRHRLRRGHDERFLLGPAVVDAMTRDERVHHRADGEEVGAAVELIDETHRLLGRHVRRRSERGAGRGALRGGITHLRDAEVEHLDLAFVGDEDVRGLEIAVDDVDRVTRREAVDDALADLEHAADGHRAAALLPGVADGLAEEQLHDEERLTLLGHVVVEDLDGRRVIDLVRDVGLAEEPLADGFLAREVGVEDLEGRALTVAVRRRVHRGHAADAQKAFDGPLPFDDDPYPGGGALLITGFGGLHQVGHAHSPSVPTDDS